jgi:hypothetical protein
VVERLLVEQDVAGSNPVGHPESYNIVKPISLRYNPPMTGEVPNPSIERRSLIVKHNNRAINSGWELMEPEINLERDLDKERVKRVGIQLKEHDQLMDLVFQRVMADRDESYYFFHLDLYKAGSKLKGRAPSGLMIIWSLERNYHRIATTDVMSLEGYSGCGLGAALIRLADTIITTKIIPLTNLNPIYSELPKIGTIEDTAHDAKGKVTHWSGFQAEKIGYQLTGKNTNGWPVYTKQFV